MKRVHFYSVLFFLWNTTFNNFEDYYNYLKSIDKDSPEINTFLNINFNDNFKKM